MTTVSHFSDYLLEIEIKSLQRLLWLISQDIKRGVREMNDPQLAIYEALYLRLIREWQRRNDPR